MKHVLIVGANVGIGYYIVRQLLEDGNRVSVLDINIDNVSKLKDEYTTSLFTIYADATDEESMNAAIEKAIGHFGKIDVAIYNACMCTFDSVLDSEYKVYEAVMNVNYYGALRLAKTVIPHMRENGGGKIIFTSSGVGVTGFGNISPYASTKGAIEALAKCMAVENERYGISFHLFHPPLTNTESSKELPVPTEFKAAAEKVGRGLGKRIDSKKFIICHSFNQAVQMWLCYRMPLRIGKLMWKMTEAS